MKLPLHPSYLTDADRVRLCSHWIERTAQLTTEGIAPEKAQRAAAEELRLSAPLLRGWTLRLLNDAFRDGQVSARAGTIKRELLMP